MFIYDLLLLLVLLELFFASELLENYEEIKKIAVMLSAVPNIKPHPGVFPAAKGHEITSLQYIVMHHFVH